MTPAEPRWVQARMKERCDDPDCPGYGQAFTDRGYGYPVCPSQRWFSERFPGGKNKPLAPEYKQYRDGEG